MNFAAYDHGPTMSHPVSPTALAIRLLLPDVPEDIAADKLLRVAMQPVVAPGHPLASLGRSVARGDLESHVAQPVAF